MHPVQMILLLLMFVVAFLVGAAMYYACSNKRGAVLICRNYNPEGGYFWQMYNVVNMLYMAEKYGAKPVVIFDSGLYQENRPEFRSDIVSYDPNNWFHYYFEPINGTDKDQAHWQGLRHLKQATPESLKKGGKTFEFVRKSLQSVSIRNSEREYNRLWKKYFKVRPHVQHMVQDFKRKHGLANKFIISCHYRGSDKLAALGTSENNPVHMPYEFVEGLIRRELAHSKREAVVIIASDEQPFVDHMRASGLPIVAVDATRSDVNTSGLDIDTSKCIPRVSTTPECKILNNLITKSIHRGMSDVSNYKKGLEVLLDVLLMSEAEVFLQSRGNVSNWVRYMNPRARTVDLVNEWHKHLKKQKSV
jgi:hypothetical protein